VTGAEESCMLLHNFFDKYCNVDKFKKNEMGVACKSHCRDEKCIQNFNLKAYRENTTLET
jgi:hypothetical protein